MMRSLRLAGPVVVLAASLACSGGQKAADPNTPPRPAPVPVELVGTKLATVDGMQVGSVGWEEQSQRKNPADGSTWSPDEKKEILDAAVADELLFQEAFRRVLYQDPKVRRIMINLLLRDEIYEAVQAEEIPDAQLEKYYQDHLEDFVVPEKVQVKRIFVAITDERPDAAAQARAAELATRARANPEAFRELATENSDGPFARRGGEIGYLDREGKPGLPEAVTLRAFGMEEGEISDPFLAGDGYNVLYVPHRRERIERTFEQMRGAVLRRMKNDRYQEMTDSFTDGLAKKSKVEIDEAALSAFNPTPPSRPGINAPAREPGAAPYTAPDPVYDEDGNPVELIHGKPKTGDAVRDEGDANDEARKRFEELERDAP